MRYELTPEQQRQFEKRDKIYDKVMKCIQEHREQLYAEIKKMTYEAFIPKTADLFAEQIASRTQYCYWCSDLRNNHGELEEAGDVDLISSTIEEYAFLSLPDSQGRSYIPEDEMESIGGMINTMMDKTLETQIRKVLTTFFVENGFQDVVKDQILMANARLTIHPAKIAEGDYLEYFAHAKIPSSTKLYDFVMKYATDRKAVETVSQKKAQQEEIIKKVEEKREAKRQRAKTFESEIPENYADLFSTARSMHRHFVIHSGPTNSGKTHDAIEAMEKHENGVYLAPLRLLAAEQQATMINDGFPCNLRTGEEEQIVDGARYIAKTVELADFNTKFECAVIDECQMLHDPDRGGAWTAAILGIPAEEVHLCTAPYAEACLINLITACGDTYEIQRHERKTSLETETTEFHFPKDVQKGDALIVFSRAHVHAVGAELQQHGYRVSIIYGALPPDVRHKQAEDFASGKSDVLVATDAIGMGMNLPIRRIVFLEQDKYDGTRNRMLKDSEIQQIAGRAGRYGIYDTGYVTSLGGRKMIRRALNRKVNDDGKTYIDFPPALIRDSVSIAVELWQSTKVHPNFKKTSTDALLELAKIAEEYIDDPKLVYSLATIPFDQQNENLMTIWCTGLHSVANGDHRVFDSMPQISVSDDLPVLEEAFREADLLYVFADRFDYQYEKEKVANLKSDISKKLIMELDKQTLASKKCRYCGKVLPWNYPYGMCEDCYEERYGHRDDWYDDYDDYGAEEDDDEDEEDYLMDDIW